MLFSKFFRITLPSARYISRLTPYQVYGQRAAFTCPKQCYMTGVEKARKPLEAFKFKPKEVDIENVTHENKWLKVTFSNGRTGTAPFLWLRDNCQCSACFDPSALGRKFLMQNLDLNLHPQQTWQEKDTLFIIWNDGHRSTYPTAWLHDRSFSSFANETHGRKHIMEKILWGKNLTLDTFDYSSLIKNESSLLDYLITLEVKGAALIKGAPLEEDSGAKLIDHIAFVKSSHFGRRSPVSVRKDASNLAFTGAKLGLHTDLAQYDYQAGVIFIHTIKQHDGTGGDSVISDGFYCAGLLRDKYPGFWKTLASNNIFFWDKGQGAHHLEMENFYKINKGPVIKLGVDGEIEKICVNDQVRDSHMDMPYERVPEYYQAMKAYNNLLYENSYRFKMENGDIITLDNIRCLHGREAFDSCSDRHIETTYLDWDEARCKRRQLQEKNVK